jgi:hypothetical protein
MIIIGDRLGLLLRGEVVLLKLDFSHGFPHSEREQRIIEMRSPIGETWR